MKIRGQSEVRFFQGRTATPIEWAIHVAVEAHRGQKRKGGEAYIRHPLRVMHAFEDVPGREGEILRAAAVLHDVVEDCGIPLSLIADQIGPEVAAVVDSMTRREGEVYSEYIARLANDPLARRVKIADSEDNLRGVDEIPDPNEAKGLRKRYEWTLGVLR